MKICSNTVIDRLNLIEFIKSKTGYKIYDFLQGKTIYVNEIGYEICLRYDGKSDLQTIAVEIADIYGVEEQDVLNDVIQFTQELVKEGIAININSFKYKYIKFYYKIIKFNHMIPNIPRNL